MRRAACVLAGLFLLIAASVGSVAADTTGPGQNQLYSYTSTCSVTAGKTVCTDTTVQAYFDSPGFATACLTIDTYSINRRQYSSISFENGCAPASSFTITSGLVATLAATDIPLQSCNRQGCTTRTVTVSASDSPSGPITTTTARTTTTSGNCTTRTSSTDKSADVSGTFTIDGTTSAETGNVSTHTETSRTACK